MDLLEVGVEIVEHGVLLGIFRPRKRAEWYLQIGALAYCPWITVAIWVLWTMQEAEVNEHHHQSQTS